MPPTKRSRPSFSPPRPRKTNTTTTTKSMPGTSKGKAKSTPSSGPSRTKPKSKSRASETTSRKRSKLVSPTPSASNSQCGDSDNNDEQSPIPIDDAETSDSSTAANDKDTSHLAPQPSSSPEPDYILAEVTHSSTAPDKPPIPLGLIHRILHAHFSDPEKTKISTDAREMVGKYIEIFVREAVMRCSAEKNGGGEGEGGKGGWLELEDLEKVAVQLCLDF